MQILTLLALFCTYVVADSINIEVSIYSIYAIASMLPMCMFYDDFNAL